MAIIEISVMPLGTSSASIGKYVAGAVSILDGETGIKYELTAMGTNVEGDLKELVRLALQMHQVPFKSGARRVVTTIKIDDRRDKKISIAGKKGSVRKKLARR